MTDRVSDVNSEIYLLGDMNIDWTAGNCPRKKKILSLISASNLFKFKLFPCQQQFSLIKQVILPLHVLIIFIST